MALRRARDHIDRYFDAPLRVADLASTAHMSVGYFTRSFTRAFGESPVAYLTSRRLQRAMALLQSTSLSVTEVCFAVGFSSLGTFSRRFRQWVGVTPSACRRERHYPIVPGCVARGALRPVRIGEAPESSSGVLSPA